MTEAGNAYETCGTSQRPGEVTSARRHPNSFSRADAHSARHGDREQRERHRRPLRLAGGRWPCRRPAHTARSRDSRGSPDAMRATRRPHGEPAPLPHRGGARQLISSCLSQQAGDTRPPQPLLSREYRRVTQVTTSGCITPVTMNPSSQMNTFGLHTHSNLGTNALVSAPNPLFSLQSWTHNGRSLGATLSV